MEKKMTFNYFYGTEADQFSFYRIPKALFTDSYFKDLSSDAKILYGLMLDRMSLSIKNQWFDDKNRRSHRDPDGAEVSEGSGGTGVGGRPQRGRRRTVCRRFRVKQKSQYRSGQQMLSAFFGHHLHE